MTPKPPDNTAFYTKEHVEIVARALAATAWEKQHDWAKMTESEKMPWRSKATHCLQADTHIKKGLPAIKKGRLCYYYVPRDEKTPVPEQDPSADHGESPAESEER